MLGKTNIMTLTEGGIVTEVEDFSWFSMQTGVHTDFVRCVCEGGYLAAITADGVVAWTTDGEVWNSVKLEYESCVLNDIAWDGERFIIVGCYNETVETGLAVFTKNFVEFEKIEYVVDSNRHEYCGVFPANGKYILIVKSYTNGSMGSVTAVSVYAHYTDFKENGTDKSILTLRNGSSPKVSVAKNAGGFLVYTTSAFNSSNMAMYKVDDEVTRLLDVQKASVFECKGSLYYMLLQAEENYNLCKVTDAGEVMTICTGQNFAFGDGVYFDECQIFLNHHGILVVRKGESLADKTVDDLIEIAPEMMLKCIAKAFGRLYMFGNQGIILRSSVETDNAEVLVVQALSAKRALAEANAYTDAIYRELESRILKLEEILYDKGQDLNAF